MYRKLKIVSYLTNLIRESLLQSWVIIEQKMPAGPHQTFVGKTEPAAFEAILLQTGVQTGFCQRDFCQTIEQQQRHFNE
jgi:hypothetical protein